MKKLFFAAASIIFMAGFFSCKTTDSGTVSNTAAEVISNWEGVYTGLIPGADSGINTEIILNGDRSYIVNYQYVDNGDEIFTYTGIFTWKNGNTIVLDDEEIPPYYTVGNGTLTQLDMSGEIISGTNAELYILRKKSTTPL